MPGSHHELVTQHVPTVLGTLEIALPAGAVLAPDPGATEGTAWWWSPQPGAVVLTVSDGDADLRSPAYLLALERSLDGTDVAVLRDEPGGPGSAASARAGRAGEHRLDFVSTRGPADALPVGTGGADHPAGGVTQRARFRFWRSDGSALRVGYRLDETTAAGWRTVLDDILDSACLR